MKNLNVMFQKLKTGFNRGGKNLNGKFGKLNVRFGGFEKFNVKACGILMMAFVMALMPVMSVAALSETYINNFAQNDILFYDPTGIDCYSGNLSGDTVMAKVVNYLKGNNPTGFVLSDNGIAGVLANFQAESGFNPFRYEGDDLSGPGYGIAQFTPMSNIQEPLKTDTRTASYFNEYIDIKYTRYDPETGLPLESVPMAVVDAWLGVQLDFFFGPSSEFERIKVGNGKDGGYRESGGSMGLEYIDDDMTAHEAMQAAKTPEDATRIFVWIMERPGDKEEAANTRSANAQQWLSYTRSLGTGAASAEAASSTIDGSNVTIIGDSITVGAEEKLKEMLPGVDVHAQVSKQFYTGTDDNPGGITILQELVDNGSLRNVLVYALGTNGNFTAEQAQKVVDMAGLLRKVVFVTNYTTSDDFLTNNNVIAKMKNDNSNVFVADWKAAVDGQPTQFLGADGIHPNEEGKALFASIITNTIVSAQNLASVCALGAVDGGINNAQAQALLDYYKSDEVDAKALGFPYGTKINCVAMSQFFVMKFTTATWEGGYGRDIAHNLAVKNSLPEGKDPRPFAIFSTKKSSSCTFIRNGKTLECGHTGIVISVQGDEIVTLEASWGSNDGKHTGGHDGKIVPRKMSYFTSNDGTFVYLDSVIKWDELNKIIGE